jgi:drug/metabolite transporter (DMT)-like permease
MPDDLKAVLRSWRTSMVAGLAGACASQLWFSAYAIEDVARVRTLAVVEMLYSQIVSARIFRERVRAAELFGIACIVVAIVTVLNA